MFLSRLVLDRRNPSVIQSLRDCHDMHRTIMKAFPESGSANAREKYGVLYRLIEQEKNIVLYVLSDIEPEWESIRSNGFEAKGCKDISGLLNVLIPKRRFAFDILVQPYRKQSREEGNSRRIMLRTPEERQAWLEKKATENGFRLEWFREEGHNLITGKHSEENGGAMFIGTVRYRGVLSVEDKEKFTKAFKRGIGPGKAYGLGMLMLSRA